MIPILKDILTNDGYSLTKPRLTVFGALQGTKPKTMNELVKAVETIVNRASVYRTVALFEELGIVNRIPYGFKYRLELSDEFTPHHHHLTCNSCHKVISFSEPKGFDEIIYSVANQENFFAESHNLEIYGLCAHCKFANQNL